MSDPINKEMSDAANIMNQVMALLGEHYDSVQVFVTRHDQGGAGGTVNIAVGSGNWFARLGQVYEWIKKVEERQRMEERAKRDDLP